MAPAIFFGEYIAWHYGMAVKEIWGLAKDFLWFGYHFFSIGVLGRTLFMPFYRIREPLKGWTTIEALLENVVANFMSRLIGLILRVLLILVGLIFEVMILLLTLPIVLVWLLFPLFIIGLFIGGILLLTL